MGCLINKGIKQYAVITDFIQKLKKYYKTQSAQDWRGIIDNLPKCINHKNFKKSNFTLGKYLLILPRDLRITFTEHNVVSCKSMCPKL